MDKELSELGPTEPNTSWSEKQDFIVRFIDELSTFLEHKAAEFELPPVVVIGALDVIKNEWLNPVFEQPDDSEDPEDDTDNIDP